MYYLKNVCFMCLKYKDPVNFQVIQHAENVILQQVKLLLPEIVILEPRLPLLICSTCHQALDDFHHFKKMCLGNNDRYNDYINKLQGPNDSSERKFDELQVETNENKLLSYVKQEENIDLNSEDSQVMENFVEYATDIKEESAVSEESVDSFYLQILKTETDFNNVQDCEQTTTKDKIDFSEQEVTKDICQAIVLKCSVCNDSFEKKSYLQKHMIMLHTNIKERKCLLCGEMFKRVVSLSLHMEVHAEITDYKCTFCNNLFVTKQNLQYHMKTHMGVKDYNCSICNKMFNKSANLKRHMKTHTGVKDYKCSICKKMYTTKHNLEYHMRTHTGSKDCKCLICNICLATKQCLEYHMTTHTGLKYYKCLVCNKEFANKSQLNGHMAIHTRMKKFQCFICNKNFILKQYLEKHIKQHKINSLENK